MPQRFYQNCRGGCPLLFPSAQSVKNQSGYTSQGKIKIVQHHPQYAQRHKGILSGTAVSVISNQCKKQKRQITDKHKLHGGMINNRSRKNNCNGSKKTFLFLKLIPLQPDITQNPVCNLFQGRQDLKVICHFNKGQQVGQKIQWVIKAVVSEIVNILPAAKLHGKIRKKISRLVKSLSEIFRKYTVL